MRQLLTLLSRLRVLPSGTAHDDDRTNATLRLMQYLKQTDRQDKFRFFSLSFLLSSLPIFLSLCISVCFVCLCVYLCIFVCLCVLVYLTTEMKNQKPNQIHPFRTFLSRPACSCQQKYRGRPYSSPPCRPSLLVFSVSRYYGPLPKRTLMEEKGKTLPDCDWMLWPRQIVGKSYRFNGGSPFLIHQQQHHPLLQSSSSSSQPRSLKKKKVVVTKYLHRCVDIKGDLGIRKDSSGDSSSGSDDDGGCEEEEYFE